MVVIKRAGENWKNNLIKQIKINDIVYEPKDVKFITNGQELLGTDVSEENPIAFRLGQSGTLIMSGKPCLAEGTNKIVIEAMNPEAGKVVLSVEDVVSA